MNADQALIEILNQAIEIEYGALFLMPQHLARIEDQELAAGLREACQDELDHAETTARLIFALGGLPKADFRLLTPAKSVREMLQMHLEGEQRVIQIYRQAIAKARDPKHKETLSRLLADEEGHQVVFQRLIARLEAKPG